VFPLCIFDTTNCTSCGNGALDPEEECDGIDFGGSATCADINAGSATEPLLCTDSCTIDLSNCSGCGNGTIAAPEDCEPGYGPNAKPDLGGQSCEGLGYDGGDLDCSKSCRFDEGGCYTCGDATRNGVEQWRRRRLRRQGLQRLPERHRRPVHQRLAGMRHFLHHRHVALHALR